MSHHLRKYIFYSAAIEGSFQPVRIGRLIRAFTVHVGLLWKFVFFFKEETLIPPLEQMQRLVLSFTGWKTPGQFLFYFFVKFVKWVYLVALLWSNLPRVQAIS